MKTLLLLTAIANITVLFFASVLYRNIKEKTKGGGFF